MYLHTVYGLLSYVFISCIAFVSGLKGKTELMKNTLLVNCT
jgi:hypothetical protein